MVSASVLAFSQRLCVAARRGQVRDSVFPLRSRPAHRQRPCADGRSAKARFRPPAFRHRLHAKHSPRHAVRWQSLPVLPAPPPNSAAETCSSGRLFRIPRSRGFRFDSPHTSPAMVELVDHLGFVERQQTFAGFVTKQMTVIRHMEHCHETNAPGVGGGWVQARGSGFSGSHAPAWEPGPVRCADKWRRSAGICIPTTKRGNERKSNFSASLCISRSPAQKD